MPTQQPEQGLNAGGKGRQKEQTLRAVTIHQLVTASAAAGPDEDLVIDGADLSNVTLLGKVLSCRELNGNIDLRLSDGTGAADVVFYADAGEGDVAQKLAEWRAGTYVRVYGHVRPFNGSRNIQSFCIRPVHDFNEVTYHFLQAIFQHLHLSKGGGTGTGATPQQPAKVAGGHSGPAAGGWQQHQPQQQQQGGLGGAPAHVGGMDPCAAAVLGVVSDPNAGDLGIHVNDICARLAPQGFVRPQVEAALTFLQNEAHAYTTCDDNHWKGTT